MAPITRPLAQSDRPTLADASRTEELTADHTIDGRYRIETLLGTGAMGAVYRARHIEVGRPVAIKVLAPEWGSHATMPARFREEARAASSIGHPNIVSVLDAGSLADGRPYIVMELLEGRQLSTVIRDEAPLQPSRACTILIEIGRAIAVAHAVGIVHRDLKPENVMLLATDDGERVKVLDFGIAHAMAPLRARLTVPGTVMGTPEYMAPEQVRGEGASPSFDIYALGVIGYEIFSGHVPIGGTTSVEIMARKSLEPSPSLAAARPDLPPQLVAAIDHCLAREPDERPSDARLVVESLERVIRGLATSSRAPARPRRRDPRTYATVASVAFLGALAWAWLDDDAGSPPTPPVSSTPDPDLSPSIDASPGVVAIPPPEAPAPAPGPETRLEPPAVLEEPEASPPESGDASATRRGASTATPSCDEARRGADAARRDHEWTRLLRWLSVRGCFPAAERARLRTKAYMELGRFDRCIATGRDSGDSEVQRMVRLCRDRR